MVEALSFNEDRTPKTVKIRLTDIALRLTNYTVCFSSLEEAATDILSAVATFSNQIGKCRDKNMWRSAALEAHCSECVWTLNLEFYEQRRLVHSHESLICRVCVTHCGVIFAIYKPYQLCCVTHDYFSVSLHTCLFRFRSLTVICS
jgi:hypothetical protein